MKIALFGGSFNPPHIGHQLLCLYLLEYKKFDKVFLIPTYKHPFGKDLIDFEHRWRMCNLLSKPFGEKILATAIEKYLVERFGGRSYTIDMVRYCKAQWPDDDFTLIVGEDICDEMEKWKDYHELNKLVGIVAHPRMPHPRTGQDVSSTRIRKLIEGENQGGEPIVELVPSSIIEYIEKHGLYKQVLTKG